MELRRFNSAQAYSEVVSGFLVAREAENNVLLGITQYLLEGRYTEYPPYLAALMDDGKIVAAAMRTPPYHLVLSSIEGAY